MSHTSMILSGLFLLVMVLFIAPNIFAMNRGKLLRSVALWLAIFLGLALVFKAFGPGSPRPMFQLPESMSGMQKEETAPADKKPPAKEQDETGEKGFTPPKE